MNTYWENGGIAPRIINLGSGWWRWVVSFTSRPLYPREKRAPGDWLCRTAGLDAVAKRKKSPYILCSNWQHRWVFTYWITIKEFYVKHQWDSVCFVVAENAVILVYHKWEGRKIDMIFQQDCWKDPVICLKNTVTNDETWSSSMTQNKRQSFIWIA
jgi:hypothetical protein